jgi:septal ring factor EnvC (AmiA/AmiB activator)
MDEKEEGKTPQKEAPEESNELFATDIEDIDAALDKQLAEDKGETAKEKEEREEVDGDEIEDKPDGDAEEESDKEEVDKEEKSEEVETDLKSIRKELDDLKAELKKKDDQLGEKEEFIRRQTTEIGTLRKDRKEFREGLREKLAEKYPGENIDAMVDVYEAHEKEEQRERENRGVLVRENERFVRSKVENFDDLLDTIGELCITDGATKEDVTAFRQNPFASSPDFLIIMAKRAETKIATEKKIQELEEEAKRLRGDTEEVVEKIERAAKRKPKVDHRAGQASKEKDEEEQPEISEDDIPNLSYEALDKELKKSQR